ncbi:MAG: cytochrome d ubiquinol oxidase subunit II [Bacteroidales bacterium]|nr:cytochrome d ubiquinol oxidase subunit II [Bacteroidales bacterium]MDD4738929.1 cytochrome d ubiquinol oxidase subunit II [Bacteroidales bacterium]
MDYNFFIQYWWFVISLLGAILVFLLFVQGGQTLIPQLGKSEIEKTMMVNSIGRKWEFTFTTLVTFGGAFFAAFPLFYSTSFGGAYWVWMIILFCFIIQAVSFEFRKKENNFLGEKTYNTFLLINGFGGTFLLGVAVGTFFTGSEFVVNKENIANPIMPIISQWTNPLHGLEALANPRNLLLGLVVLFLSRTLGSLYFINNINDQTLQERAKKALKVCGTVFVVLFVTFLTITFLSEGFAVDKETGLVSMEKYKYFNNLIEMPVILAMLLIGVVLVLYGLARTMFSKTIFRKGIWFAGIGTVMAVLSLFLIAGYNNTAYYPSIFNPQSSLTIYNSSSSLFTLKTMSIVSLIIPFVLAYIFYAWRKMDKVSITKEEMQEDGHKY